MAGERRGLLVSRVWVQATLLVVLCGFFILGLLAYRTYMAHPPVPKRVVDSQGRVLYTGRDIQKGQQVFLHNGLMEYGSAFGHGAYLGPDFTADYLRRSSDLVRRSYGGAASDSAGGRTITDLRTNRYDEQTKTLTLTSAQAAAFRQLVPHYSRFFSDPTTVHGLRAKAITDLPGDIVFIVGGALPALYIAYLGIRHTVKRVTLEEPEDILFTEIGQPEGSPAITADEATAAKLT